MFTPPRQGQVWRSVGKPTTRTYWGRPCGCFLGVGDAFVSVPTQGKVYVYTRYISEKKALKKKRPCCEEIPRHFVSSHHHSPHTHTTPPLVPLLPSPSLPLSPPSPIPHPPVKKKRHFSGPCYRRWEGRDQDTRRFSSARTFTAFRARVGEPVATPGLQGAAAAASELFSEARGGWESFSGVSGCREGSVGWGWGRGATLATTLSETCRT